ncbi:MAG: hypothetical protein IKM25_03720, partial [Clostridia bacterium]|nr:hypothetical protein [Clostridia bacterium]
MADNIKLGYNKACGKYEINHNGFLWVSDARKPYVTIRKKLKGKYISVSLPFWSALNKKSEISENKIITNYSGFV